MMVLDKTITLYKTFVTFSRAHPERFNHSTEHYGQIAEWLAELKEKSEYLDFLYETIPHAEWQYYIDMFRTYQNKEEESEI